jgi:DNA-binding transcriptional MocR family regulator
VAPPDLIREIRLRHDYTTLTPGMISDALASFAMQPQVRENILSRTRTIIRTNLPSLEGWIAAEGDPLTYVRPVAGAIAYLKYDLRERSTALAERIREEQSVLLVPGDMFGLGRGFRIGFGFDAQQMIKGLDRVGSVLADIAAKGAPADDRTPG